MHAPADYSETASASVAIVTDYSIISADEQINPTDLAFDTTTYLYIQESSIVDYATTLDSIGMYIQYIYVIMHSNCIIFFLQTKKCVLFNNQFYIHSKKSLVDFTQNGLLYHSESGFGVIYSWPFH